MKNPHVVIVGGGFGGLSAAKVLARHSNIKVTLIDKRNYHLFQPLLYQVATAGLSPAEIAYPLRALIGHRDSVDVILGEVTEIDLRHKRLKTEANELSFDYLILACGSTYTYFNAPQWEPFAPGLKTIEQATEIRRRIFLAFEKAEREADPKLRAVYLTFVVVGGGPTGVELAGALGEISRHTITKDFKRVRAEDAKIILVEAGPRVLPTMSEALSRETLRELAELGVEVRTNAKVLDLNEHGIRVGDAFIHTSTVLWAAGVAANPLNAKLGVELDRQGRVVVTQNLSVAAHPHVFVIGDQAHFEWGEKKTPLPGLAPVAMQQGRFVARNIVRRSQGKVMREHFVYVDKGQMATIGRSRAVAMYKGIEMQGLIAWFGWLLIHIYYLIGFKNRLFVLIQWAWTYVTYQRGARLIIDKK